jgi:hypothetical protein
VLQVHFVLLDLLQVNYVPLELFQVHCVLLERKLGHSDLALEPRTKNHRESRNQEVAHGGSAASEKPNLKFGPEKSGTRLYFPSLKRFDKSSWQAEPNVGEAHAVFLASSFESFREIPSTRYW